MSALAHALTPSRESIAPATSAGSAPSATLISSVMILPLDPDPESDFQLFGDSGSGFASSKKQHSNTYRGIMNSAMDPDLKLDFQPFDNYGSGFGSSKK